MITGSAEYKEYLATLADSYNPPNILIRIPADEPIYKVDLNSRVVEAPKMLGVESDHEAELIYFMVDRYFDQVDLAQCVCAIQFRNAYQEEYMYIVPAYDTLSVPGKIIFAWNIQSPVTKYGGNVEFSFKFFKIDKTSGELLYELNTLVSKTKVLVGWATKNGANHKYNTWTVNEIITDKFDENGNIEKGLWSKLQELFDAGNELNVFWKDL